MMWDDDAQDVAQAGAAFLEAAGDARRASEAHTLAGYEVARQLHEARARNDELEADILKLHDTIAKQQEEIESQSFWEDRYKHQLKRLRAIIADYDRQRDGPMQSAPDPAIQ